MTSEGWAWAISETSAWQKAGSAARGKGGAPASACGGRRVAAAGGLSGGRRSGIGGFSRFLANPRVTVAALPDGWGAEHGPRCAGRHIPAIEDTSASNFTTTTARSRGPGEIGKGSGRGVLRHAMQVWMPRPAAFRAGYGQAMAG